MKPALAVALVLGAPLLGLPSASADTVDSLRFGVMAHNIAVIDRDNADKEDGPNINGEILFTSPGFLKVIGAPKPYIMASANVSGETSFAAVGLSWDWEFADGWHFEPGFGYAVHDGELNNPFPPDQPIPRQEYQDTTLLLGSRDLFRTSLALTKDISEDWAVQLLYEHLSHGQILGEGTNQGLDELGVRFVWRLD
jgi:lipid A 3-O-deacylase